MLFDDRGFLTDFLFFLIISSLRILRLCLLLVRNHSIQQGFVDVKIRRALNSILKVFLEKWRIFKEKEKEREDEEGSLFKFKNKSHGPSLSEDEENKQAVSKAFPSFDRDFKDIMASQDLNETGSIAEEEVEPSQHSPVSDVELFMANMTDFSEITKVHEEMYCRLPSNREVCVERKDFFFQDSVDALYLEALQWSYRTSAIVNTIIPCKLLYSISFHDLKSVLHLLLSWLTTIFLWETFWTKGWIFVLVENVETRS